jgi:hypothetical protein
LYVQERRKAALDIKVLLLQNKLKEEFPTVEMFDDSREFIICSLVPIIYKNIKEASKKQKGLFKLIMILLLKCQLCNINKKTNEKN